MVNVSTLASLFTLGSIPGWGTFVVIVVTVVWSFPAIKAKVNEARKIELDADGEFRADLLKRIGELEAAQAKDRLDFYAAMAAEKKRCNEEMDVIRARLRTSEDENKGLQSMIRQFSQSSAMVVGDLHDVSRKGK